MSQLHSLTQVLHESLPVMQAATVGQVHQLDNWLRTNQFGDNAEDFRFAFCNLQEAEKDGGLFIAQVWQQMHLVPSNLPSTWKEARLGTQVEALDKPPPYNTSVLRSKPWKGLRQCCRRRTANTPEYDLELKRQAADEVLALAVSWPGTRLNLEWAKMMCAAGSKEAPKWWDRHLTRLSQFEAGVMRGHRLVWKHWQRWCEERHHCTTSSPPHILESWYTDTDKISAPTARFNTMKWFVTHLYLDLDIGSRPAPSRPPGGAKQAVAEDPEIAIRKNEALVRLDADDVLCLPGSVAQAIWCSGIRFRHIQRSVLTRLTTRSLEGVCIRGKHSPGFPWIIPRFGPGGFDVGLAIWTKWQTRAIHAKGQIMGLCFDESSGELLSHSAFQTAVRSLLQFQVGLEDAALWTSYSSRKSGATLGEQRNATETEMDHLNGWNLSRMPTRYAGDKNNSAKLTRHLHLQLVAEARLQCKQMPLDWSRMRSFLATCSVQEIRAQVLEGLSAEKEVAVTPSYLLKGLVQPPRQFRMRFAIASKISSRSGARKPQAEPVALPLQEPEDTVHGQARSADEFRWILSAKDKVHLALEGDAPVCARRQAKPKPLLHEPLAAGDTAAELESFCLPFRYACDRCLVTPKIDPMTRERFEVSFT